MKNLMLLMVVLAMFGPSRSLASNELGNGKEPQTKYQYYSFNCYLHLDSELLIKNSLDDRKPEGYQFGPVTEIRVDPPGTIFRIVSYNYAALSIWDSRSSAKSNPILQIWKKAATNGEPLLKDSITEYEEYKLVQEFRLNCAVGVLIENMGWISVSGKPAFYVIVHMSAVSRLITIFQLNDTNDKFEMISQDQVENESLWVVYDIDGIGDCFVGTINEGGVMDSNYKGWSRMDLYNYSDNGVLAQYETTIDDILSPDIIDKLYANGFTDQYYISAVSCGLKYALHRFTKYEESDFYNEMFTLENTDGTKYYSRYGPLDEGWVEVKTE
ncbi:MAG: hypothetical protein ABIC40_05195 [bacterium]